MSDIRILIDFGSTFTKLVAFDMESETLCARAQAPSSVDTDVTIGLRQALEELGKIISFGDAEMEKAVACSSAAGGLRMVCIGLVPEYTTKAGHLAALGAGAKVVGTYSYELSGQELSEIEKLRPDIVLLTGGTDGGNKKNICNNARLLAGMGSEVKNIIVAGNKSARDEIEQIFGETDKNILFTKNVMPEFGVLELETVNKKIRELFLSRIMKAKGIAKADGIIGGGVVMPTPSAVLEAAKLIAEGAGDESGLGEMLLVDVGGATTDVYSMASGTPTKDGVHILGLREPFAKRTVEGDLGLFHNLDTLAQIAVQVEPLAADDEELFEQKLSELRSLLSVPEGDEQTKYQLMLSHLAVKTAVDRHVGRIEPLHTHDGDVWVQRGKDLSDIEFVLGAGGPLAFSANPRMVLEGALAAPDSPNLLKPKKPRILLDQRYIMYAIGLLSQSEPEAALRIIKKYLKEI